MSKLAKELGVVLPVRVLNTGAATQRQRQRSVQLRYKQVSECSGKTRVDDQA
jgi:hypothetical protein